MRRLVLIPIVAVLLAACGTEAELPQLPLSAGGAANEKAMAADTMMRANIRYELADGVTTDVDHATAYRLTQATADDAKKLAAAFGIDGEVSANESGWSVGTSNEGNSSSGSSSGSSGAPESKDAAPPDVREITPSLYLGKNGSFSVNGNASVSSGVACAEPADEPADCPVTTTTVAPNLPSESEARAKAQRTLTQAGIDVSKTKVDVERLAETVTVRFSPVFSGKTIQGFETTVAYGANAELLSAFGYVGEADEVGSYELVSLARAVERLNEGFSTGGGREIMTADAAEPAIAPGEPNPSDPEPVVVTLTAVRVGLMLTSDDSGNTTWLTPAYVFTPSDTNFGDEVVVPAAADKYFPTTTTSPPSGDDTKPPATDGDSGGGSTGSGGGSIEPAPPEPAPSP